MRRSSLLPPSVSTSSDQMTNKTINYSLPDKSVSLFRRNSFAIHTLSVYRINRASGSPPL